MDYILTDKESGKDINRPAYQALKGALGLRKGDILYIVSLDRLSRNKEHIKQELQWFQNHGIRLKILDLPTSLIEVPEGQEWIVDMVNNILIEVLAREGIEVARKKGKHLGRPRMTMPEKFPDIYEKWKKKEITARKAMELLQMSSSSVYRMAKQYESNMP